MKQVDSLPLIGLAGHLVDDGLLDENVAKAAWQQARLQNQPFVTYLIKNHLVTSSAIVACCAQHFGLPIFCLTTWQAQETELRLLHEEWVRRYRIIPLSKQGQIMQVGISDPSDRSALDAVTFHTGLLLEPVLVNEEELNQFIEQHYNQNKNDTLQLPILQKIMLDGHPIKVKESPAVHEEPIIQFVDQMIHHAQQQGASDLHIEPYEHLTRLRYRQDGLLYEIAQIEPQLASRVITRLKVMADLDIAERRLPQDGRFTIQTQLHKVIDVRASSCPTQYGEKIVLRLLDHSQQAPALDSLGLIPKQKALFLKKLNQPQGLILVTGPTGSGKTLTLYSALDYLNSKEKNILTIEDPIEIQLEGINQVHLNPKAGLDFTTALRAFLRQDPDIIMVGEIRDKETAEIAMQAAQTGHLVLSTLHTNSAAEALTRLLSMGIPHYQIAETLTLVIAQRLIRKLCIACKKIDKKSSSTTDYQQPQPSFRAYGCRHCRQGYHGRTALFECLDMSARLVQLTLQNTDTTTIVKTAQNEGFMTLREIGLEKIRQGETSFAELNRVLL